MEVQENMSTIERLLIKKTENRLKRLENRMAIIEKIGQDIFWRLDRLEENYLSMVDEKVIAPAKVEAMKEDISIMKSMIISHFN
ncbi:MAG: hypothetical protein J6C12_09380 [Lachnospiraceae bacterium]|nr:hypothetical protein [Lachnospiraceae bacterium]